MGSHRIHTDKKLHPKIVTARAMQRIDKEASGKYGIAPIILMENAAIAGAFTALQMLKSAKAKVAIFCGQGNNGGDGFACARHLINRAVEVRVYFTGRAGKLSTPARLNYQILRKMGRQILKPKPSLLNKELSESDLIIDALLGIGLKSKVRQPLYSLIQLINSTKKPVLSLDIPSGLNATSGKVCGIAVKAKRTITFGLVKKGLLKPQAADYIGKLAIGDISLPHQLLY
jgi:hydroxyethylthiazole kinase-like uncharacterized protein yjeF